MDAKMMGSSPKVEDDESRSSANDAFGTSGQWGCDNDGDAEDASSIGSLELKVTDIFQAA
jgi:hypothetical protein